LLTPQISRAASGSQEAAPKENRLPLSRGPSFTDRASVMLVMIIVNAPDYPTSVPQSKGN